MSEGGDAAVERVRKLTGGYEVYSVLEDRIEPRRAMDQRMSNKVMVKP